MADLKKWLKVPGQDLQGEEEFSTFLLKQAKDHPVVLEEHGQWNELIEWAEGNQFSMWNSDKRQVVSVELTIRKKRVVINLMKPLVETLEGKINLYYSVIGVPNSGENTDIYGSQVATKLIAHNDNENGIEDLQEDLKYDLLHCGTACRRWVYDKNYPVKVAIKKTTGGNGQGKTDWKVEDDKGEVVGEAINIFNIRPNPAAKNPRQLEWVVELKEISVNEFKRLFPDFTDEETIKAVTIKGDKGGYRGYYRSEAHAGDDTVLLMEFTEKPNADYPDGRSIIGAGNKIVHAEKNANPGGHLGYYFYYYRKNKRSFWGKGPLHYIQGIQREFNRMVSIQSEHHESWKPKLIVPTGSTARYNSLVTDSLELVELNYGASEPKPMQMPELSPQLTMYRDFLVSSVDRVSNVHEVSYARLPQYATRAPASLYSMMLEQESIKLDPMVKRANRTLIEECRFRLMLMGKYYSKPRVIKIFGANRAAAVGYYETADLSSNFDVMLSVGISINQSKTVEQKMLLELWDRGVFRQQDSQKLLKLLNLGTLETEIRSDIADSERAQRENQMFIDDRYEAISGKNRGVWVYIHDDHALHLDTHTALQKSEEAEQWDDDRVMALEEHIMKHWEYFMKLKEMQANAAQEAGSAEAGGAAVEAIEQGGRPSGAGAGGANLPGQPETEEI